MTDRSTVPCRTIRTLAATATACSAALCLSMGGWAPAASASGGTGSSTTDQTTAPASATPSDLQVRAQELAGQIEANGRSLDELDASYNAAQIRMGALDKQLTALKQGMARTTGLIAQAHKLLEEQALLAYLSGGAPLIYVPDHPGQDPSLTIAYAQIIAGGQERAAATYRTQLDVMNREEAAVRATEAQASATLSSIGRDRAQASSTLADQHQALAQVQGQMAVLVAQVEARQQNAQSPAAGIQAPPAGTQSPAVGTPAAPAPVPAVPAVQALVPAPQPPAPRSTQRPVVTPAPPQPSSTTRPPATTSTTRAPTTTSTTPAPAASGPVPAQAPGAGTALAYARAQLGKPYQWAGAAPDSFDCSGLVMRAWGQAGVQFPHLAQSQYDMTARIPLSQAEPGDLIFFGTPGDVYHVGIYIGNGQMIDAPETGQNVSIQSIYWDSLLGAGRVHS